MKKRNLMIALTMVTAGIIIGVILTAGLGIQQVNYAQETKNISPDAKNFLGKFSEYLSEVAEAVEPAVVNISTTTTVTLQQSPFGDFSDDPFFRRFFGDQLRHPDPGPQRKYKSSALGSGVIITADGYILTNNHVVKDADDIKVVLYDDREFKGKVIGTDPQSDLAVVKINAEDLPSIKIGDSDVLKVGEVVIAIGNPFALSHTITMGIVSALGRSNVGIADYEDFIQTDAAINPGNSGGALVNMNGELIGINTAIFSKSGGYMGIGFAIPSSMAKSVMDSIIKHGKVIRGWLGVSIQNMTPDLAEQFDIKEEKGALVTEVVEESPAEKAGFKRGDLIIEFDGKHVDGSTALRNMVAGIPPDTSVKMKIIREGKEKTLTVAIGQLSETVVTAKSEYSNAVKGVHVQDLNPEIRMSLDIPQKVEGVVVTNVEMDSPSFRAVKRNDVIQEINKKAIRSTKDYEKAVSKISAKDTVLILAYRGGGYIYITIKP
ncbi:MAG TPA: DegQ family serine endoprotease [Nitrospirae bacterium]|nr:putative periplasmic serine endoprotease DegP-like precursor [bacterium BMS3Bbin08]HDH50350.1 DegQ family serine endoprotease [Nitrospirota bacterium]HDK16377.1 DegQ family serine endoprotease [Nitrospirota bacterium]HDK81779.1 DegQ family serine endoprotease [Nitrospirota bacterium]